MEEFVEIIVKIKATTTGNHKIAREELDKAIKGHLNNRRGNEYWNFDTPISRKSNEVPETYRYEIMNVEIIK